MSLPGCLTETSARSGGGYTRQTFGPPHEHTICLKLSGDRLRRFFMFFRQRNLRDPGAHGSAGNRRFWWSRQVQTSFVPMSKNLRICCEMMRWWTIWRLLEMGFRQECLEVLWRKRLNTRHDKHDKTTTYNFGEIFLLWRDFHTSCGVCCNVLFFQVLKRCAKGCQRGFLAKTGATPEIQ